MMLEEDYVDSNSERRFESIFAMFTGSVGGFFLFVSILFARTLINNHRSDTAGITLLVVIFLLAYWFFKLSYKLALHKCTYLLSTIELKVTGWFFILFVPSILILNFLNHQRPKIQELIPCTPAILYGYYALKVVKKRTISTREKGFGGETSEVDDVQPRP